MIDDGRIRTAWNRLAVAFLAATLAPLASCYSYHHYTEDPAALDYLFFGSIDDTGETSNFDNASEGDRLPGWSAAQGWQVFTLFGLVPWDKSSPTFAAEALALHKLGEPEEHVFTIETKKSPLNALSEGGLGLTPVVGLVQPFFLNWRSVRVRARPLQTPIRREIRLPGRVVDNAEPDRRKRDRQ